MVGGRLNEFRATDPESQILLAKSLLERGLLTPDQLREAITSGGGRPGAKVLAEILVSKGYIPRQKIAEVLAELAARTPAGSSAARPQPPAPPQAAAPSPPSTRVQKLDKYTLVRELGRGGMGVVYEAVDNQLGRKVALKLMLSPAEADPRQASVEEERFVREAKLAAQLKHPNIVTVYDAGVIGGRRFLAMELVEGKPFSTWRKQGNVHIREQVAALREVALAVHYAHEQGVLHRDLKPRNILVDGNNRPFVTDFGLAKTLGKGSNASLTASGMVVGTPTYMSPEQCQGSGRVDWRSDIWSLGVMLYEIISGRPPFEGDSPMDIMTKVVHEPVPPPSKVAVGAASLALDGVIEGICMKALEKDPKQRYPTARAFADDLKRWVDGQSAPAAAPKTRKIPRRAVALGAAAASLAIAAVAAYLIVYRIYSRALSERIRLLEEKLQEAERARKEAEDRTNVQAHPADHSPPAPDARTWQQAVDLLPMVNPSTDAHWGTWSMRYGHLTSDRTPHARIEIPYEMPEEYDVRMTFTRQAGSDCVSLILPAERSHFAWEMGAEGNRLLTLAPPGAREEGGTTAAAAVPCIENNRPYTTIVRVRRDGVQAFLDDKLVASMSGDPSGLGIDPRWKLRHGRTMGIGSHESPADIQRLEVLQITGGGRRMPPPPPAVLKPQLDESESLKPGLVGEYYYGTYFGSLAQRRIDTSIAFNWEEGFAWPDGPPNAFSVRWSGYLKASKGGRATFTLSAEGAARLLIGGTQVMAAEASRRGVPLSADCLLEPGFHELVLEFFECGYRAGVNLAWSEEEGRKPARLGPDCLFHDPVSFKPFTAKPQSGAAGVLSGHTNSVTCVAFSPDGRMLVSAGEDGRLILWDVQRRHALAPLTGHNLGVLAAAFSPDGRLLASGGYDRRIRLWDVPKRSSLRAAQGHRGLIRSIAFSPDGGTLASAGHDRTILLWDASGKQKGGLGPLPKPCASLAFAPEDGSLLAAAGEDPVLRLWDVERIAEPRNLVGHADSVQALAFSPDGRMLASASKDYSIKIWDAAKGCETRTLAGHKGEALCVAFHPTGKTLASGGQDALIRIWDAETGDELRALAGHAGMVTSLSFSPDGSLLASGSIDKTVRLWQIDQADK